MNLVDGDVTLRAIERSDNMILKDLLNDPETERDVGGWSFPVSIEGQDRWFEYITNEKNPNCFRYAIDKDGTCVGMAGFHDIDYKNSSAQVDIKMLKTYRGQGIGTTSMKLLMAYAFDELNLHCLLAEILEDNAASRKMHEKAGFTLDGILRDRVYKNGKYHNQCAYSILKEEYRKKTGDHI